MNAVQCGEHGTRDATYVCRHLVSDAGAGFNYGYAADDPDRLWPDAWCDACDQVFESEGGWNERATSFADIQLLCDGCYQRARERNWTQDDDAFRTLLSDAMAYLKERQDLLYSRHQLGSYSRYDWSQDTGQLIFSEHGRARVIADIQFVGSISTRSETWLWSWANPSNVESVKDRVRRVRAYGDEHEYLKLASACWTAAEVDGWEMTAIACYLIGAQGAYRSPGDRGFTFLAITDARWAR